MNLTSFYCRRMADIDIDVDSIIARLLEGMYVLKYTY